MFCQGGLKLWSDLCFLVDVLWRCYINQEGLFWNIVDLLAGCKYILVRDVTLSCFIFSVWTQKKKGLYD